MLFLPEQITLVGEYAINENRNCADCEILMVPPSFPQPDFATGQGAINDT
jgi:hypothetical protein